MRRLFCMIIGFLLASPALAITGADLQRWCNADDLATCDGFLLGTASSLITLQNWKKVKRNYVCLPASISEQKFREIVIGELSARSDLDDISAASVTLNTLRKHFPCK